MHLSIIPREQTCAVAVDRVGKHNVKDPNVIDGHRYALTRYPNVKNMIVVD